MGCRIDMILSVGVHKELHTLNNKEISIDFLEKLKQSIDDAIKERERAKKKLGTKSVIPAKVLDYEVEE